MIEDLVDLLDRSWKALEAEVGVDFAIHCFPFHEQLTRDARTNALLSDLRREEVESRAQRAQAEAAALAGAGAVLEKLRAQAPDAFEPSDPESARHADFDTSPAGGGRR